MHNSFKYIIALALAALIAGCNTGEKKAQKQTANDASAADTTSVTTTAETVSLPEPSKPGNKYSNVIGWASGKTPVAPEGFQVEKFATNLRNPRWIYQAPNGDIFVSEANTEPDAKEKIKNELSGKDDSQNLGNSANRITLFRDSNQDGKPDTQETFLSGLKQPFGMLILNNYFYVANTDGLWRYPYKEGQTFIKAKGEKILELPAGGYNNHWTRNIIANADGSKIYISVGSASNVGEHGMKEEERRAAILEVNPDGSGERIFASGLRNPVGMDWAPGTNTLWTAVNERDELGDELVPDYITSVQEGAFYG